MSSDQDLKSAIFQLIENTKEDRALYNARFERIEGSIAELIAAHGQTIVSLEESIKHEIAEDQQIHEATQEIAILKQTIINVAEAEDSKIAATQVTHTVLDSQIEETRAATKVIDVKAEEAHKENLQLKAELDVKTEAVHQENSALKAELDAFQA